MLKNICYAMLCVAILSVGSVVHGDGWLVHTSEYDCTNVIELFLTKYTGKLLIVIYVYL